MKVTETPLPGVLLIEPRVFGDERGFFLETYHDARYAALGIEQPFRQDNHSRSTKDVLRGLHYQLRHPQGKLVSVARGAIFDVAVDIRVGSPTFGWWYGVTLSDQQPRQLWIPAGYAHGFCVLSDVADVVYKCTDLYAADDDRGVIWSDPSVGIEWPIRAPILSPKDQQYAPLDSSRQDLPRFVP